MKSFLLLVLFFCSMMSDVWAQWTAVNNNLGSLKITGLARIGTTLYAGTADKGIFTSADNGDSWSAFADNASLPSLLINGLEGDAVTAQGMNIYTQNGFSMMQNSQVYTLQLQNIASKNVTSYRQYQNPSRRFIGTISAGLFFTDDDVNWTEVAGIPAGASKNIRGMMSQDADVLLLVGTENGVFASTDRGNTWKDASLGLTGDALKINNMFSIFALTGNGVYLTNLSAFTGWMPAVPTGDFRAATAEMQTMKYYFFGNNVGTSIDLMTSQIAALSLGGISGGAITSTVLNGTSIFVGTETGGVFRAQVSNLTDVNDEKEMPGDFSLSQNYPNPFNPSTTIDYSVAAAGNVSLKVYSVLGTEVATLVNKEMKSGNYSVKFDAKNLSSGIYFYQLRSGNVNITKRMLLIK